MSKYLDLAKKLNELAKRGEGGEQVNAAAKLADLMEKYDFTMRDIEGEEVDYHYFKMPDQNFGPRLFLQVAVSVLGSGVSVYRDRRRKGFQLLETTAALALEIRYKFDFYCAQFQQEADIFFSSFIHVNDLYAQDGPEYERSELLTKEEIKRLYKIKKMAENMEAAPFFKQIDR